MIIGGFCLANHYQYQSFTAPGPPPDCHRGLETPRATALARFIIPTIEMDQNQTCRPRESTSTDKGVMRPSGSRITVTKCLATAAMRHHKAGDHDKRRQVCCNDENIRAGGSCAWSPVAARRTRFAQTQTYRSGTIGTMKTRLRLSSTTAGKPVLASVSIPINSSP